MMPIVLSVPKPEIKRDILKETLAKIKKRICFFKRSKNTNIKSNKKMLIPLLILISLLFLFLVF